MHARPSRPCGSGRVRVTRTPAFGVAVITPLVFAGAVGGARLRFPERPSRQCMPSVTPVAAVSPDRPATSSGPTVIAIQRAPTSFHVAAATTIGAAATDDRECAWRRWAFRSWHCPPTATPNRRWPSRPRAVASAGTCWPASGASSRATPAAARSMPAAPRSNPIYGPALDGTLPGNEVIVQSSVGNRVTYARAMGPMQFLPGTWARYAADGDGDGIADPQNLFDATLAAARYLCSGGLNLRDPVAGHGRDPALQQLDALRAERAGLGGGVRHRRGTGRPAADHRAAAPDRRRAPRAPGGARAQPAAEHQRPAGTTTRCRAGYR